MWNPFKRGSASNQTPDRVQELANRVMRESRIAEFESELEKLKKQDLSPAEQASWWHCYGIEAFRSGRHAEALERFKEGHARFPQSALIRFSLAQQYVMVRQIDKAFELFAGCRYPEIPTEHTLAQARYAYLWDRYDEGRACLRPILEAYKQLRIMDDTFLFLRRLPFFSRWWNHLAAFSILTDDWAELEEATDYAAKSFSDLDIERWKLQLMAHRENKPELLLPDLEKTAGATVPANFPTGYVRMHAAVIRARASSSRDEAEALLEGVALAPNDFPWLRDVRTLTKAEIAQRFGLADVEMQNVEEFLQKQRLLFEPDIACAFHLLRYQEKLKPMYRSSAY